MYTQIVINKLLLFFFAEHKDEWKQDKFRRQNNKKSDFYNKNKKIFDIIDIDVNKILVSEKKIWQI